MSTDTTPAALDLPALYSALESARNVLAFSSRDWGQLAGDAWLYGILLGWGADPDDEGGTDAMDEVAAQHGWSTDDVERLKTMHAAVEGLTINAFGDAMGQAAEVERLRDLVEQVTREKCREKTALRTEHAGVLERLHADYNERLNALSADVAYWKDEAERFHRESRDDARAIGGVIRERNEARAEMERLRAYVDHLHEVHGDQLDQVAEQRDVAVRELATYRPPISGAIPHPTYDQIVKAWQDTLDQQDEWQRVVREGAAEVEQLRARVAELEDALTRAENEVEALTP